MIKRFWTEYPAVGQSFNLKTTGPCERGIRSLYDTTDCVLANNAIVRLITAKFLHHALNLTLVIRID
mgnify:CR=1 FL=1